MARRSREREIEDDGETTAAVEQDVHEEFADDEGDGFGGKEKSPVDDATRRKREDDAAAATRKMAGGGDVDDEDEGDSRAAFSEDGEEDGAEERRRLSRRQRRNRAHKQGRDQSAHQIAALAGQVTALSQALEQTQRTQLGQAGQTIDGEITALQGYLADCNTAIGRAVKEQDDVLMTKAMSARDEALARLSAASAERHRLEQLVKAASQPKQPQQQHQAPRAPDPVAISHADDFLEDFPFFDPNDEEDPVSQKIKEIDDKIMAEGYIPTKKAYWSELRRRVQAAGIEPEDDMEDDDSEDTRPARREKPASGGLPPRSRRGDAGSRKQRTSSGDLPAFAKETLDELGLLNPKGLTKPDLARREKYIKTWAADLKAAEQKARR